jgi:hypothetical protein
VVLIAAAVVGVQRWNDRGPEQASVDDARERFRSSSTVAQPATEGSPPAGVYVYSATGRERLSFLDTAQPQGPTSPGTVTSTGDGCWKLEIAYNSFHSQGRDFCATGGQLVERGGTTQQRFDFVAFTQSEHAESVCDPPSVLFDATTATPGDRWPVACRTKSQTTNATMTSTGETVFVGRERIDVGGKPVSSVHVRQEVVFEGDQTGSQVEEFWFALDNWMPLRNTRVLEVVSPAPEPIGSVTYTEEGSWQLTSLTPRS